MLNVLNNTTITYRNMSIDDDDFKIKSRSLINLDYDSDNNTAI